MIKMRGAGAGLVLLTALFATQAAAPVAVRGAETAPGMPTNASADRYGTGWQCDRGYRPSEDACSLVTLPQNAHLDYSGNDWERDRPYDRQGDGCVLQ